MTDELRQKLRMPVRPATLAIGAALALIVPLVIGTFAGRCLPFAAADETTEMSLTVPAKPTLDRAAYDRKMRQLAHLPAQDVVAETPVGDTAINDAPAVTPPPRLWPVQAAYPEHGAILPFKRIVAYYGNFYSRGMGVLGEYDEDVMLEMWRREIAAWAAADPTTPVQPAVDYIAIVAQADGGKDGMYRARMPHKEIDKALAVAAKIDGIVILEVQSGLSDVMTEVRTLEPYLKLPQVHLAIDPEFAMKPSGARPGHLVGTVDATDVNAAIKYLADLTREHDLPPKVLIVHRYTRPMVTNAAKIIPRPEVQVVVDMDGWGPPEQKYATYNSYVASEPVQFTGFKLFYKNDIKRPGTQLLTPAEVLKLLPQPSFIQYQ